MTNVIKIVLQFLNRVLFAFAIRVIYLCPSRDPRFDQMPEMIKRNFLLIAFDDLIPLRPRPDQTHIAPEHIPKLWQFIQPQLTQSAADPRDSRIALARVNIIQGWVAARNHRAEFMDRED